MALQDTINQALQLVKNGGNAVGNSFNQYVSQVQDPNSKVYKMHQQLYSPAAIGGISGGLNNVGGVVEGVQALDNIHPQTMFNDLMEAAQKIYSKGDSQGKADALDAARTILQHTLPGTQTAESAITPEVINQAAIELQRRTQLLNAVDTMPNLFRNKPISLPIK